MGLKCYSNLLIGFDNKMYFFSYGIVEICKGKMNGNCIEYNKLHWFLIDSLFWISELLLYILEIY